MDEILKGDFFPFKFPSIIHITRDDEIVFDHLYEIIKMLKKR